MRTCFELVFDETEALSLFLGFFKLDRKGPALPFRRYDASSIQTEVCSPPSPYLTLLELVSEEMLVLSLFLGFFKLDLKGPLEVLPRSKTLLSRILIYS